MKDIINKKFKAMPNNDLFANDTIRVVKKDPNDDGYYACEFIGHHTFTFTHKCNGILKMSNGVWLVYGAGIGAPNFDLSNRHMWREVK